MQTCNRNPVKMLIVITSFPSWRKCNTSAYNPMCKDEAQIKVSFIRAILSLSKKPNKRGITTLNKIQTTLPFLSLSDDNIG